MQNRAGRRFRFFFWLVFLWPALSGLLLCPRPALSVPPAFISLGTYNLENLFDVKRDGTEYPGYRPGSMGWDRQMLERKLVHLARVIEDLDADILALQEVESRQALALLNRQLAKPYPHMAIADERPSTVKCALLSRCQVISLYPLPDADLHKLLLRAANDTEKGIGCDGPALSEAAAAHIISISDGDSRAALNALELAAFTAASAGSSEIRREDVETALQRKALAYDKDGEEHYNLISAFHKSLRGSDPDASLYWLARMMAAGEDPLYIARRMVRFASEDVGCADPRALTLAKDAAEAYRMLGSPEGDLNLAQAAVYLACAPKSNRVYAAYTKICETVRRTGALPVPYHIRNAPTRLMKEEGYAEGYRYPHDHEGAVVDQDYLPDRLRGSTFYQPADRGYEQYIRQRLEKWREMMQKPER